MKTQKELQENLRVVEAVNTVTNAYQEIARMKMNRVRKSVLKNREFLERLSVVYFSVKSSYLRTVLPKKKAEKKDVLAKSFIKKNNKEVVIFLSSNQPFYGDLILNIWKEVVDYLKYHKNCDLVIVGRLGKFLAESQQIINFYYFELSDDNPKKENLRKIVEFIKHYKTITVVYGKFVNPFIQKAEIADISGNLIISEGSLLENLPLGKKESILFEPSPEEVLSFFETEIVSSLLNQIIWEHQLAKFASRMIAMYRATENAKDEEKRLIRLIKRVKKEILNKKQINIAASFKIWLQKITQKQKMLEG